MDMIRDLQFSYVAYFFPMLVLLIPSQFSEFITLSFGEHLHSDDVVIGLGIAQMTLDCLLTSYMYGFDNIFEAYAGAIVTSREPGKLGELMVKVLLQGALAFFVSLGPYLNVVHVVQFFGAGNAGSLDVAILYIRLTCPVALLFHVQDVLGKYLAVQGYTKTTFVAGFGHLFIHTLFTWISVDCLGWGVGGIALATIAGYLVSISGLVIFCWFNRNSLLWSGLTSDIWEDWADMMKLGNYSGLRVFASFSLYALSNILCQVGGTVTAGSVVVIDKINILFNTFVYTGGSATALIVGNKLGEESEEGVKKAMLVGVINWILERSFSIICLYSSGEFLARFLTSNEGIVTEVVSCYPVIVCLYLLFGLDELLAKGIMTPFGMQNVIGIVTPISIFGIGYTMMFYMVYRTNTAAKGIFLCFVVTHMVQCITYVMRLAFVNVSEEIVGSSDRIERSFGKYGSAKELHNKLDLEDTDDSDELYSYCKNDEKLNPTKKASIFMALVFFAAVTIWASFV